jgi:hypothetical protein
MNDLPKAHLAGGVATQKGINYQNRVAAALAVACISETAPGMDLPTTPIRVIRCESGEPVGDILLELADGALLFIEVKRSIRLSDGRFAALVEQLIKQFMACEQSLSNDSKPWRRPLRSGIDRLQIITSSESPEAVRKHLAACLDRIGPAAEPSELLGVAKNNAEDNAFTLFKSLVTAGWKDQRFHFMGTNFILWGKPHRCCDLRGRCVRCQFSVVVEDDSCCLSDSRLNGCCVPPFTCLGWGFQDRLGRRGI